MTPDERTAAIELILDAAAKPCPDIVDRYKLVCDDGSLYFATGVPAGVNATDARLTGRDRHLFLDGTTYGTRYATRAEAINAHNRGQKMRRHEFAAVLNAMEESALTEQLAFWTKQLARR